MSRPALTTITVDTPHGPAAAHLATPAVASPAGLLTVGHGAGGGIDAPDIVAVAGAATLLGWTVALVEQPYRVAGKRVGPRPAALDAAWTAVVARLRADLAPGRLVVGGRSAGARVACRTAAAVAADGVLCLAFPTRPPGRPDAPSRVPELDEVRVPVLVVQGERDPYGAPPPAPGRVVALVPGTHALRTDVDAVVAAVDAWLPGLAAAAAGAAS